MKNIYFLFFGLFILINRISVAQTVYSLQFNGTNSTVNIGNITNYINDSSFTIETWIKFSQVNNPDGCIFVLGGNGHFTLYLKPNNRVAFHTYHNPNIWASEIQTSVLATGIWYHIAATFNRLQNKNIIFLNGIKTDSTTTPTSKIVAQYQNSNIGSYVQPTYGNYFNGKICGMRLKSGVFYNSNFIPPYFFNNISGTIAVWQFYEGSGIILHDSSGSNYNGTISNAVWSSDHPTATLIQKIYEKAPQFYSLQQNYPNPFNPNTNIKFQVKNSISVKLVVFDILGKEVAALVNEKLTPGTYETSFDASHFSSGIYFYKLTAGDYSETRKMTMIK